MSRLQINSNRPVITPVHYHKHFHEDLVKFKTLSIHGFNVLDRDLIRAILKTLVTGDAAAAYAQNEAKVCYEQGKKSLWTYTVADHLGQVGMMRYKGVVVAVYYKRDITETMPAVGEKPPEWVIKDPEDVWQRLDVLGPSAKRANILTVNKQQKTEEENNILRQRLALLEASYSQVETRLNKLLIAEAHKKDAANAAKAKALAKSRPKLRKPKKDRLCMTCKAYENVHDFKGAKCVACWCTKCNGKPCAFRPKGVRLKRKKGKKP